MNTDGFLDLCSSVFIYRRKNRGFIFWGIEKNVLTPNFDLPFEREGVAVFRVNLQRLLAMGQRARAITTRKIKLAERDMRGDQARGPVNGGRERADRVLNFIAALINFAAQQVR